ncbi:MAG TPA: octaprenyl diphosphate synthase, partial [Pusillimonas sp.]|nr:octaprenyl diphosphate synthase [Pusillimonas sp.]
AHAIQETDALQYTRETAEQEAELAREQLGLFPASEAQESLLKFCSFAVDRDR